MFKYNVMNDDVPGAFNGMFSYRHDIHVYTATGTNHLRLEQFPTKIGLKRKRYCGANLWNDTFLSVTDVKCIHVFKARFKGMLLDNSLLEKNTTSCICHKCITVS